MNTNDPLNLKSLAEKLSPEKLADWLEKYLRNRGSSEPPFSVPSDDRDAGTHLGVMLKALSPTWDSPTHVSFADAVLLLFRKWRWENHPTPLNEEDYCYILDVLFMLEGYPTSNPSKAAECLCSSLLNDALTDEFYARTMLAFCGQLYRHPNPSEYGTMVVRFGDELKKGRALVPALSCLLAIDPVLAILELGGVYASLKARKRGTSHLLTEVALRLHDQWPLLVETATGHLGEHENEILAGLEEEHLAITKIRSERKKS